MNKIKFSHRYFKLREMGPASTLVAVFPYDINDNTPKQFLEYDTGYIGEGQVKNYPLKKGKYVILLFLGLSGLFTTIRPLYGKYGNNKLEYYSSKVGESFEIEIEEE